MMVILAGHVGSYLASGRVTARPPTPAAPPYWIHGRAALDGRGHGSTGARFRRSPVGVVLAAAAIGALTLVRIIGVGTPAFDGQLVHGPLALLFASVDTVLVAHCRSPPQRKKVFPFRSFICRIMDIGRRRYGVVPVLARQHRWILVSAVGPNRSRRRSMPLQKRFEHVNDVAFPGGVGCHDAQAVKFVDGDMVAHGQGEGVDQAGGVVG